MCHLILCLFKKWREEKAKLFLIETEKELRENMYHRLYNSLSVHWGIYLSSRGKYCITGEQQKHYRNICIWGFKYHQCASDFCGRTNLFTRLHGQCESWGCAQQCEAHQDFIIQHLLQLLPLWNNVGKRLQYLFIVFLPYQNLSFTRKNKKVNKSLQKQMITIWNTTPALQRLLICFF